MSLVQPAPTLDRLRDHPATRWPDRLRASLGDGVVRVAEALTVHSALAFCRAVRDRLAGGNWRLRFDLGEVQRLDVVGVGALLQSARLAALLGVEVSISPSAAVRRALLDAELLDELPLVAHASRDESPSITVVESDRGAASGAFLAATARLGLRRPRQGELAQFERWAHEPLLEQMVGSELLFRCRHLGADHPDVAAALLGDVTSLTLLVSPLTDPASPIGFVRLYKIRLLEQIAFLETAVANPRALRKGWGIEASRLLVAYAMDILGLRRIEAKVYAYNVLSINALRRNGFRLEGVLREARTYDGQHWDILVYSILREEMEEQRRQERFPYMGLWS